MIGIIKDNWGLIIGGLSSVGAYFGGRKLKKADEKKATSEALETMQKTYDTFVIDFRERYAEIKEELKNYRDEQIALRNEITQLRHENTDLRRELKDWECKYINLKKEFDLYKKEN